MFPNVDTVIENGVVNLDKRFMIPTFLYPTYDILLKCFPGLIANGSTNDRIMRNWMQISDPTIRPDIVIQGRGRCENLSIRDDQPIFATVNGYPVRFPSKDEIFKTFEDGDADLFRTYIETWYEYMVPFRIWKQHYHPLDVNVLDMMFNKLIDSGFRI